ncbi:TetR/AcrR family transcriptional regulator [Peribacillus glennii]|uniref:TetR/AcrR family transcriptional regulator n=1 Tax=Peribacillus glennii TaxID=2303991 RepID=A0A372L633_9BACI|nr:TetR/AcrR family transcriptional regulator [Peribacillus glennii]RFU60432.1 TetR/AcrR family transcriptional regulator [Peribacillus glennii]
MKEKEKVIMEAAIKLFGKKGYDATSVQEIVNEAGISKGAFYLYYKSKQALLLAIFQYYYDGFITEFEDLKGQDLPPRQLFIKQIETQYRFILGQKEFLIMQARERVFNESIGQMLNKMRNVITQSHKQSLSAVYGAQIEPYVWDLTMLVQGMMHPYLELLIFDKIEMDLFDLGKYILQQTDQLAEGFINSESSPLLTEDIVMDMELPFHKVTIDKGDLLAAIQEAKEKYSKSKDLLITIEVLEEEIKKEEPRIPVIEGMLANLKKENKLKRLQTQINDVFNLQ